jgi:hypothetical protein
MEYSTTWTRFTLNSPGEPMTRLLRARTDSVASGTCNHNSSY